MARLVLVRERAPGSAAFDTAASRAVMLQVAAGVLPETFRLYRPARVVAFGRQDERSPGFHAAVAAAAELGYESVVRLAGGRAALFHEGTLAFAHSVHDDDATQRTFERFRAMADLMAAALKRVGVDARVGEIPGEYCPGDYSVNAGGRVKLVGIGQRIVRGAAHVGGVVVAEGGAEVRRVLTPVYRELGLEWDPSTASSVNDESGATWNEVEAAIVAELSDRHEIGAGGLEEVTLERAAALEFEHRA